ncbi:CLaudin-like in Caenorhabditis [Caenorhabditis elegans]|uniref:CLaudin-like in Caenorhabditis n=1 Tax=Caenorhabditis elegans TaxID=6239 RepID=O45334_CAEEL|nr:Uncharacterized protein CELE_F10A3.1 [Caenorhabditis elegans]CAB07339.1 Uncharacterized protein CELE_F10A3.1 [Caenorhabditis elegans]|eukprot:NP_507064.1 Uncharacterized protein CELE_F10A3.1 [Caenorhabditis elegans]
MSAVKRLFLNIVVCIGIVCNFFGVFSQAWITDYGGSIGIVPFYSTEVGWYALASWMMYISVACHLLVTILLTLVFRDVRRNGYCHYQRSQFFLIAFFSLMVTILTVTAVILIGVNLPNLNYNYNDNATLGYSAWVSVAAAVCYFIAAGLALSFAFLECRCC